MDAIPRDGTILIRLGLEK